MAIAATMGCIIRGGVIALGGVVAVRGSKIPTDMPLGVVVAAAAPVASLKKVLVLCFPQAWASLGVTSTSAQLDKHIVIVGITNCIKKSGPFCRALGQDNSILPYS